jgi:hypothetical protein
VGPSASVAERASAEEKFKQVSAAYEVHTYIQHNPGNALTLSLSLSLSHTHTHTHRHTQTHSRTHQKYARSQLSVEGELDRSSVKRTDYTACVFLCSTHTHTHKYTKVLGDVMKRRDYDRVGNTRNAGGEVILLAF